MAHRGPDGAGLWVSDDKSIGLGHRRLSILDLAPSAGQPMSNEDATVWVTFNGEIYNYAEVRQELVACGGHRWKTDHSDTEVIVHGYEQWGIDVVQKLRGMFAMAIWDNREKTMYLVRDRTGIKPLYYCAMGNRLIFASEIKAILQDPTVPRRINDVALYHYLSFLIPPAPFTMFEGIKKLPSATYLKVRFDGSIQERKYWNLWRSVKQNRGTENQIVEELRAALEESVSVHKVSDVPVGVFLSGGIDSSTNTALFSRGESKAVQTFTIGYQGQYKSYSNETSYARAMADHVGATYHERLLSLDDMMEFLPRMVHLQDEPIADPVCFPVYYVSKLARDNGVTVCQVGEGADELFWGYPGWKNILRLADRERSVPGPIKKLMQAGLCLAGKKDSFHYEYLRRSLDKETIFWGGAEAFPEGRKRHLVSERLRNRLGGFSSWDALEPLYNEFRSECPDPHYLNWMSYVDLCIRLPELLLMRVDKMSMGVSLETRVPFLDYRFVETAMGIPAQLKVKDGVLKYILKKAVRGLIPDKFIDRPKQGFDVPIHEWFFERLGDTTRTVLKRFCNETDLLDWKAVQGLIERNKARQVWYLLNLGLWWEAYIAGGPSSLDEH
jgi:asparagine synthase (glutamine-hydrolysing)